MKDEQIGDWVQSVYGAIGEIVGDAECNCAERVHARYVYGTANVEKGAFFHTLRAFTTKVPVGTPQPPECMDPIYWAMMV